MAGVLKAIFEPRTNCAAVKHANRWATNTLQPLGKRCSHHARTRALWTHSLTPFTLYHRLSNRLDNRLNVCLHDAAYCSTGCSTGLTTGWTTGCIVYTNIQPVVKPVVQPLVRLTTAVEQPAASCKQTFNRLLKPLNNRFDNRLYRVNGVCCLLYTSDAADE